MFLGAQISVPIPYGEVMHRGKRYACSVAIEAELRNSWEPRIKPNEQICEGKGTLSLKIRCVPKDGMGEAIYYTAGSVGFKDHQSFDPTEPFDPPGFMATP